MKSFNNKFLALILIASGCIFSSCYKKFDTKSYAPPLSIGGFTSTAEIGSGSLVGYWAFDGSLIDSVSKNSGTNTGTSFTKGIKGQALQGANNGYVLFNPGPAILTMSSFTITYWVNSPVNTNGIVGLVNLSNTQNFWGNIDMFFENGSTADAAKFRAHITNGNGNEHWIAKDGLPAVFNNWTAFAVSYDAASAKFKFYVNGNLIVTDTDTNFGTLSFANSGPMVFGTVHFQTNPSLTSATGSQPWASYLTGQMDEVRFYNKALSDNEVSSMVKLQGRGK
ncbi:MAG TPA: LamG domain-containing protein [Flavisolibacter sp.]|nr:LamG domain-containing protein [Flavisolibacter sp.]